jgi:threonine/homoserine/homoserine lactone efflux protein
MELLLLFFNSFVVGFSGAIMPGPLLAVDIAETPRTGWQTGPVISIGHAIAEIGVVVVLVLGVASLAKYPIITSVIGVAGGAALIVMGVMMAYDVLRKRVSYGTAANRKADHKLAGKGITATLSNPYWFIWWATIGLAFIVESRRFGLIGPTVFYFGHILSDFVWYTVVSVILWKGKKLLAGGGLKVLILACAAFLLYLGVTFIYHGLGSGPAL